MSRKYKQSFLRAKFFFLVIGQYGRKKTEFFYADVMYGGTLQKKCSEKVRPQKLFFLGFSDFLSRK
jgi:hypothetical protein